MAVSYVLETEEPNTVRAHLLAGGDPTVLDGWTHMAEAVCERHRDRERSLRFYADLMVRMAAPTANDLHAPLKFHEDYVRAVRTRCRRILELLSNEAIAARFELALPAEVVAAYRDADEPARCVNLS